MNNAQRYACPENGTRLPCLFCGDPGGDFDADGSPPVLRVHRVEMLVDPRMKSYQPLTCSLHGKLIEVAHQ